MTTLVTASGKLLRRTPPAAKYLASGGMFGNSLWTNGETAQEYYGDGSTTWSNVSYETIYETQPAVGAAVNLISREVSTLPLKVYKRTKDNDRERQTDHPLNKLFNEPAPARAAVHLKQWIIFPLLIFGNALLVKFRDDPEGPPTELLPMDWRYVSAWAEQGGPVEWWETNQTGERRFVHASDVVHFAWESPSGQIGVSPLRQLAITLRMEDAVQRHTVSSFRQGIRPDLALILHPDARYDDETRRVLREGIQAIHGGPDRSGGVFIAGGGSDVKTLSHTAKDAELLGIRHANLQEVAMVYNVKPTVLGDLTHGTYSNVTELNKDFYKKTLRPWLTMIEESFEAQLLREESAFQGVFCEFDLAEQLRGDPLEEAQALKLEIESGQRSPNEVRRIKNLPPDPSPEADKLYLQTNNLKPIDAPPEEPPAPPKTVKQIVRDDQGRADKIIEEG